MSLRERAWVAVQGACESFINDTRVQVVMFVVTMCAGTSKNAKFANKSNTFQIGCLQIAFQNIVLASHRYALFGRDGRIAALPANWDTPFAVITILGMSLFSIEFVAMCATRTKKIKETRS